VKRKGFTLIELLVVVAIIALLISILLPSLSRARELAKRAVCASNMRGVGQGLHIYANDNTEWLPVHFFKPPTYQAGPPITMTGMQYVGQLGLNYHQPTSITSNSSSNHPSRSLFLLMIGGQSTAGSFICPSGSDQEDDMRNRGTYAVGAGSTGEVTARPGKNRFDFAGYTRLSYGYQLPYGRKGRPRENMDSRMPISADKGPYYTAKSDNPNQQGGNSTAIIDIRSPVPVPTEWVNKTPQEIIKISNEEWRYYNSFNHNQEGQSVLYIDSHVDFQRKPIAGVHNDNIYTAMNEGDGYTNQRKSLIGQPGDESTAICPLVQTDSYLVP